MRLLTDREGDIVWIKVEEEFYFYPSMQSSPFLSTKIFHVFALESYWDEAQESLMNSLFCLLYDLEIYALDWQHDCFLFNPNEKLPLNLTWYDETRNCNVYFPSYYPDGDYHFFIAQNFSYGIIGHPWRMELWVFGSKLVEKIQISQKDLCLKEKT